MVLESVFQCGGATSVSRQHMISTVDVVRRFSLPLSLCRNVIFLTVRIVIHFVVFHQCHCHDQLIRRVRENVGSRESYFCLFATVGPFPMEISGRDPRDQGQADRKCDNASVSVVTLVVVVVWFC